MNANVHIMRLWDINCKIEKYISSHVKHIQIRDKCKRYNTDWMWV